VGLQVELLLFECLTKIGSAKYSYKLAFVNVPERLYVNVYLRPLGAHDYDTYTSSGAKQSVIAPLIVMEHHSYL